MCKPEGALHDRLRTRGSVITWAGDCEAAERRMLFQAVLENGYGKSGLLYYAEDLKDFFSKDFQNKSLKGLLSDKSIPKSGK